LTLRGNCNPSILDTYETERRPIGKKNCDWGLFTFQNSIIINAAIGLVAGQRESNAARFAALFEDSEVGKALRAQVSKVCELQNIEFSAHNIELGFRYHDGVLLHDGTYPHGEDPLGQHYVPSTQPGNRLPHAWIDIDNKGRTVSTHDFVGSKCSFALLTDEYGGDWAAAAKKASLQTGVNISVAQIGRYPYMRDWDDDWVRYKEIRKGGALLVRPDNFVAWRSLDPSKRKGQELVDAFRRLLRLDNEVGGQDIGGLEDHAKCETNGHVNGY
jgi:2,4-dichlorophenol 6-monooxygenase